MAQDTKRISDPRDLKALAHPLRMSLLGALRRFGPATSTHLATRFDETTGATSYHLRQLARHGFVEEVPERGRGRERWWRATATMTSWRDTDFEGDAEGMQASDWLQRHQAQYLMAELDRWLAHKAEEDKAWRAAAEVSDYKLRLTPQTLTEMRGEFEAVLSRYVARAEDSPDARDVLLGLLAFPQR